MSIENLFELVVFFHFTHRRTQFLRLQQVVHEEHSRPCVVLSGLKFLRAFAPIPPRGKSLCSRRLPSIKTETVESSGPVTNNFFNDGMRFVFFWFVLVFAGAAFLLAILSSRIETAAIMGISGKAKSLRVGFIHPDLGIGGAERLVVDAAVALQHHGHSVSIYTSHCSPTHSFVETQDGTLDVKIYGDFLPRSVFGKARAACAYIRMLYTALVMKFWSEHFDIIFCDSISLPVPLLRTGDVPVLFYCHYPDKYLCVNRASVLKRLYRIPLDTIEERTTLASDKVFVNSEFTKSVFARAFPGSGIIPEVLYPALNLSCFDAPAKHSSLDNCIVPAKNIPRSSTWQYRSDTDVRRRETMPLNYVLSINRFERKKDIELVLKSFSKLIQKHIVDVSSLELVVAGGYDPLSVENAEYARELVDLAYKLEIEDKVNFLFSFTDAQKISLLKSAMCVLYSPSNEHFGIVPIEAMYCRCPVIAVNSGGPIESIVNGVTGYLCSPEENSFAEAMERIVGDDSIREGMREAGRTRVIEKFSLKSFGDQLNSSVVKAYAQRKGGSVSVSLFFAAALLLLLCSTIFSASWRGG